MNLTLREKEIAALIAEGQPKKAIADALHISTETVMVHTKNLYRKTGSHCTADITRYVVEATTGINIRQSIHSFTRACILVVFMSLQGFMMTEPGIFDELRRPARVSVTKTARRKNE